MIHYTIILNSRYFLSGGGGVLSHSFQSLILQILHPRKEMTSGTSYGQTVRKLIVETRSPAHNPTNPLFLDLSTIPPHLLLSSKFKKKWLKCVQNSFLIFELIFQFKLLKSITKGILFYS